MIIDGSAGKYPVRDIWSNDGGGRALEEQRRTGSQLSIQREKDNNARTLRTIEGRFEPTKAEFARQQSSFAEKYGADALIQLSGEGREAFLKGRSAESVKQLLSDLSALDAAGVAVKRAAGFLQESKELYERISNFFDNMEALAASGYDSRFLADDEGRLAAYNRSQAASERLSELREINARDNAAREAGKVAEAASLKEKLGPPSALYSVNANGAIAIDFSALENIGPGAAATSELARLIGVLAERNGLGQLRDGLIGIVNGQNRRLAERTDG